MDCKTQGNTQHGVREFFFEWFAKPLDWLEIAAGFTLWTILDTIADKGFHIAESAVCVAGVIAALASALLTFLLQKRVTPSLAAGLAVGEFLVLLGTLTWAFSA